MTASDDLIRCWDRVIMVRRVRLRAEREFQKAIEQEKAETEALDAALKAFTAEKHGLASYG